MKRYSNILARLNVPLSPTARILDFVCGAGRTVYRLLDQGYDAFGYDVNDYLELRTPADRSLFFIADSASGLPFEDNSFDLILTEQVFEHVKDQVGVFRELHRILRPDCCAIHTFPARYSIIEPHTYVPLGGVIAHRW